MSAQRTNPAPRATSGATIHHAAVAAPHAVRARDNPFAADRIAAITYEPRGWTWEWLLEQLAAAGWRGAIVGPHGSGKTTLLDALAVHLAACGLEPLRLQLNSTRQRFGPADRAALGRIHARSIVLLDGAEQLSRFAWLNFAWRCRSAAGVVVTAHDHPPLPALVHCRPDADTLRLLVDRLLGPGALSPEAAAALFHHHDGNLRHALRDLYDRWSAYGTLNPHPEPRGD